VLHIHILSGGFCTNTLLKMNFFAAVTNLNATFYLLLVTIVFKCVIVMEYDVLLPVQVMEYTKHRSNVYNLVTCDCVPQASLDGYMIHCMSYAGVHSVGKLLCHFLP
jgi:hypothetical protein